MNLTSLLSRYKSSGSKELEIAENIRPLHASTVYHVGSTWMGFSAIRRLVIFGDSYSSVEFLNDEERPSATDPLGIDFPGLTYNESGLPNWVGHLITKYCPEPRYNPENRDKQTEAWNNSPLLVHDYAKGGQTVAGVQSQIANLFLPTLGKKPKWAPWTAQETLFITWVGINDCGVFADPADVLEGLFTSQERLYKAGARNFLFFDVPTLHLSLDRQAKLLEVIRKWNTVLGEQINRFSSKHKDATVLRFSAFRVFEVLLDDPETFGLDPADLYRRGGSIWMDHIHPTSAVHDHIASNVADFLSEIPSKQ
ncbi:hypothetical protein CVT25_001055 [Psilocybe cyanescens]|uniref:Carbohydrate esterase family 16 protein n=1 Tax=Psilocybe cyanescens TaxID=93625 RepID=A0A409XB32_PSICY|nr:hypothetical protein CVT25_001055 [Psilocybe cyanescens]